MALPDRITRPRRGLRGRWRLQRRLAGIAKGLAKDATFAAKFAMFNALTKGEPPSDASRCRGSGGGCHGSAGR